jgi:hypothetical protein
VPENLLTLLNYLLIALLYLFFARVLWAVWSEVKVSRGAKTGRGGPEAASPPATAVTAANVAAAPAAPVSAPAIDTPSRRERKQRAKAAGGSAYRLIVLQPPERAGATYPLTDEMTIGRAPGCYVSVPNDTYASSLHARVYQADGLTFVEDLGSTNGTFVNGARISGATALRVGDRVQVGATLMEAE